MANIKFVWQAIDDATLTATSTNASYPLSNLLNRNPAIYWLSGTTIPGQSINIDLISARSCDSCIIEGTNFASTAHISIILQYSSDTITYTTAGTFSLSSAVQKLEFTSVSRQYWRIYFNGTASTAPQIGNIFLGTRVEMTQPYDTGIEKSSGFATSQTRAIDGTRYTSQLYNGLKKYKIKFTNINETDKTYINTLFEGIRGSYFPFYFIDADSTIVLVYSVNDENPLQTKAYQIYDTAEVNLEAYSVNT